MRNQPGLLKAMKLAVGTATLQQAKNLDQLEAGGRQGA